MLEVKNATYTVEEEGETTTILRDINLTLEDGKFYVITGPNGGGKSSLAKIIMGIYPVTSGKILFNGKDITTSDVTERARMGIGFAFQQPPRFKGITVGELLYLSAGESKRGRGCNFLFDVGLCPKSYIDREVSSSLSGGELKRIEIATLMNRKLDIAIFDEPEAGIDLWSFSKLTETFRRMHERSKTTIVIISHQERIMEMADEIILVADGQIQQKGDKDIILPNIYRDCNYTKNCLERIENVDR